MSSCRIFGFAPSAGFSGNCSRLRIAARKPPETRKLTASTRIAYGAVTRLTSPPAQRRAREVRSRAADLELRVALHELLPVDQRGEVRLIRDVEEDREAAREEADDVELPQRDRVERVRDRDAEKQQAARHIGGDQNRAPRQAVDPDTCRKRQEEERRELDRPERRHLERARVEDQDRDERDRQLRDDRAELADRLAGPQLQEVAVAPEAAARKEATHRAAPSARTRPRDGKARRRRCRPCGSRRSVCRSGG